jgi:hypothetical protein
MDASGSHTADGVASCAHCGAPLAGDQRYCLNCGHRNGAPRIDFRALLGDGLGPLVGAGVGVGARVAGAAGATASAAGAEAPDAVRPRREGRLAQWRPSTAAAAICGVLVLGVMIGVALDPNGAISEAANSLLPQNIVVDLPPPAAPASPATGSSSASSAGGGEGGLSASAPVSGSSSSSTPSAGTQAASSGAGSSTGSAASTTTTTSTSTPASSSSLPAAQHIFVVMLSGHGFNEEFGTASKAPYLAKTLTAKGELLTNYDAISHGDLPNYVALISGQAPNPQTAADCTTYSSFVATTTKLDADGQLAGQGCIYPNEVKTLPDQLAAIGDTWRGYFEDMAAPAGKAASGTTGGPTGTTAATGTTGPAGTTGRAGTTGPTGAAAATPQATTCRHPATGAVDDTQTSRPTDSYTTRHNPFVYFQSIVSQTSLCSKDDVDLSKLTTDLKSTTTTPNFSLIVPNLCHDGHDATCADGTPGGLTAANTWLEQWIPKILASPAYKQDGLLVITTDQAPASGPLLDNSSCCDAHPGPAGPKVPAGGGRVGALLLSRYVKPGTRDIDPYNHYALLRTIDDIFGFGELGFAGDKKLKAFDAKVFNNKSGKKTKTSTPTTSIG